MLDSLARQREQFVEVGSIEAKMAPVRRPLAEAPVIEIA